MRRWGSDERRVYVDLDQVGFLRPAPVNASLQAAHLGVIWRNVLSRGANRLIANGMVATNEDLAILRHAVRPEQVQALRLAANPDTLWGRIRARSAGPARLINDDLENATPEVQRHVHRVEVGQSIAYAASNLGDDEIDAAMPGSWSDCVERVVEGSPQLVKELAEDRRELRWRFTESREYDPAPSGVVNLDADLMRTGHEMVFPSDPKSLEVVRAPVEACADDIDLRREFDAHASGVVEHSCSMRVAR